MRIATIVLYLAWPGSCFVQFPGSRTTRRPPSHTKPRPTPVIALPEADAPFSDTRKRVNSAAAALDALSLPPPASTPVFQAIALGLVTAGVLCHSALDANLASIWATVRATPWFRHDMFEPLVAVGSFFVWIHLWLGADMVASSKRFPRIASKLRERQIVPKPVQASGEQKMSRWYAGWPLETAVYLLPLWAIATWTDWFAPRRAALNFVAPSAFRVAKEVGLRATPMESLI
mmetsp:Transcript_48278/g.109699  ORF Transcript_48278/g.109699 Transcript_48278/m.109699 type:complete len:232 (+) Transcript_48278:86-781(+)